MGKVTCVDLSQEDPFIQGALKGLIWLQHWFTYIQKFDERVRIVADACIYLWLCWVFLVTRGLSLVVASRGHSCCSAWTSCRSGFSCCQAWALEQTQQLWCMGWMAPWHVVSSWTRDWTCVPCIGRRIFNQWTTREALKVHFSQMLSTAQRKHHYTCCSFTFFIATIWFMKFLQYCISRLPTIWNLSWSSYTSLLNQICSFSSSIKYCSY